MNLLRAGFRSSSLKLVIAGILLGSVSLLQAFEHHQSVVTQAGLHHVTITYTLSLGRLSANFKVESREDRAVPAHSDRQLDGRAVGK